MNTIHSSTVLQYEHHLFLTSYRDRLLQKKNLHLNVIILKTISNIETWISIFFPQKVIYIY